MIEPKLVRLAKSLASHLQVEWSIDGWCGSSPQPGELEASILPILVAAAPETAARAKRMEEILRGLASYWIATSDHVQAHENTGTLAECAQCGWADATVAIIAEIDAEKAARRCDEKGDGS